MKKVLKSSFAFFTLVFLFHSVSVFSQKNTEVKRVSYTLSNVTLKTKNLDIRYFDSSTKKTVGYGLQLGPLQSHADNKPVGTRIYLKNDGNYELAFVLADGDNGRKFNVGKDYKISREQWLQASYDELAERTAALENPDEGDDLTAFAQRHNVPMVTFVVTGKSPLKRQVYVRAQLPFMEEKTNNGFSRKISSFSKLRLSYPAGTKIYLCDGPYWNGGDVNETLLLTVDAEKENYLIKI
jgi:hypothetical protein